MRVSVSGVSVMVFKCYGYGVRVMVCLGVKIGV